MEENVMIKQLEYAESILRSNPMNAYDIAVLDEYAKSEDLIIRKDALYVEIRALWLIQCCSFHFIVTQMGFGRRSRDKGLNARAE